MRRSVGGSVGSRASTQTKAAGSQAGEDRFDAIEDLKVESIPVMGEAHEALGEVDEAALSFAIAEKLKGFVFSDLKRCVGPGGVVFEFVGEGPLMLGVECE